MRITLFLIVAFASLFLFVAEASACTCGGTTVAASKNYATIVFSGRIIKKVKSNAVEKDGVEVTFQVDRVWKGKVGPSVKIYSGPTSDLYDFMDLCSPDFELGDRYVVFARGEKRFSNVICSHTTKLEDGKDGNFVLDELGRGRRPAQEPVTLTGEIIAHRWRDPESGDNNSVFLLQLEEQLEKGSKNSEFVFVYVPHALKLPRTIFEKRTFARFTAVRTRTCDQSINSYNDAAVEENRRVVEELRIKDRRENPVATESSLVAPLPNLLKSLPPFDTDKIPRELTLKCYTVESLAILSQVETRSGVNFRIYGAEKVCLGEPIFLEARLTNDGERSIQVEAGSMWRNFTETAFDRSSTKSTLGGIPLKIPRMRATSADGFQIGGESSVLTLGKGESFSSFLVLNRSDDDFYDFPGRYAIGAIYSSDAARKSDGKDVDTSKPIEANEYVFQIVDCEVVDSER